MESHPKGGIRRDGNGMKPASKYFPAHLATIPDKLDDNASWESLTGLAERDILHHVNNGVSLACLWKDAYTAMDAEYPLEPYHQYLLIVRKLAGRMLARELAPDQIGAPVLTSLELLSTAAMQSRDSGADPRPRLSKSLSPGQGTPKLTPTLEVMPPPAKLSPQADAFSPAIPAAGMAPHPAPVNSAAKPGVSRIASFEERCKKLGLRVSAPRKS